MALPDLLIRLKKKRDIVEISRFLKILVKILSLNDEFTF